MSEGGDAAGPRAIWLGETARDGGGFRRISRFPEPLALSRLRAQLLGAALGGDGLLEDGLAGFQSWKFLTTLAESAWTDGVRRDSPAARRLLRRRLRMLGTRAASFPQAAALTAGSAVHVRGVARRMPAAQSARPDAPIWQVSTMTTALAQLLVEEGQDFFLADDAGATACVIAARGYLINADALIEGETVSVFGFVDRIADARADSRSAHARGELSLAVRSGDTLPLLVRRVGGPQQPPP
jgi:hypothetical protein